MKDDEPKITEPDPATPIDCSKDLKLRWSKNVTAVKKWWLCVADEVAYKAGEWNIRNEDFHKESEDTIFAKELLGVETLYVQVIGTIDGKRKNGKPHGMEEQVSSAVAVYPCKVAASAKQSAP